MKLFDRIKDWASFSEDEKVSLERRALLRGMAVTAAGILVPGATLFDMGRVVKPEPQGPFNGPIQAMRADYQQQPMTIQTSSDVFGVGDMVKIAGERENGGIFEITKIAPGGILTLGNPPFSA